MNRPRCSKSNLQCGFKSMKIIETCIGYAWLLHDFVTAFPSPGHRSLCTDWRFTSVGESRTTAGVPLQSLATSVMCSKIQVVIWIKDQ